MKNIKDNTTIKIKRNDFYKLKENLDIVDTIIPQIKEYSVVYLNNEKKKLNWKLVKIEKQQNEIIKNHQKDIIKLENERDNIIID